MKIYNTSQNNIIAANVKIAKSFVARSIGLLSKEQMTDNDALILKPCCSIHTYFMKFEIDVIFVNRNNQIIALYEKIKPNKILPIHITSAYVIELNSGIIKKQNIKFGDIIKLEDL